MLDLSSFKIAKSGILLYDNLLEYSAVIIESDVLYGTGDEEDPPEIAEDKECHCYYIGYDSPAKRGEYRYNFRGFLSLDEAIKELEGLSYFSHWVDDTLEAR